MSENLADVPQSPEQDAIRRLANSIRALSMDAVEQAKSGHPGLPMGMAGAATVLFLKFLKFDASDPHWPDRDRFVLSAGHGSMLLYSLLWLTGYPGITLDDLKTVRQVGSPCAGHPDADRPARPGHLQRGRHGDRRAPPERAFRRRSGEPQNLCHRQRRRPDGRHQPRGDRAGGASEAQPPD